MREIYGFYLMPKLANNNIGITATFGELSRQAKTYTTEDREYAFDDYPNATLQTFRVVNNVGQNITFTEAVARNLVAVGDWVYKQHKAGAIPSEDNRVRFDASISAEFPHIKFTEIGLLKRSVETSYFAPVFLTMVMSDGGVEYTAKIYLSNEIFLNDYEPYAVHIIPPVASLESFTENTLVLHTALSERSAKDVIDAYNVIRDINPNTALDTFPVTWVDPTNQDSRVGVNFTYVAYGVGGTNLDNVKAAIRDYLETNAPQHTWRNIFPQLYDERDISIIPLWDRISVPGNSVDLNLYASFTGLSDLIKLGQELVPTAYGTDATLKKYVTSHAEVFSTPYRGMLLLTVANPANANGKDRLSKIYPDYSAVPSSADFERMEEKTREFSLKLTQALEIARTYNLSKTIPSGFFKLTRNNKTYIAFLNDGFQHLVITRDSYLGSIKVN